MVFAPQIRVEYSSAGLVQTDALTPLDDVDLDRSFKAEELSPPRFVPAVKRYLDCTSQFLSTKKTLTLMATWVWRIEPNAQLLAWLWAHALGHSAVAGTTPKTFTETMLGESEYELPYTSMRFGYATGGDVGRKFRAVVLDRLRQSWSRGPGSVIAIEATFLAAADPTPGASTSYAPCFISKGIGVSDFTIGGTSYRQSLASAECEWNNDIYKQSDPFTADSPHVQRWRRNTLRGYAQRAVIDGIPNAALNSLYSAAIANTREGTRLATSWMAGVSGNSLTISEPDAYVSTQDDETAESGEAREVGISYDIEGLPVSGNASSPLGVVAVLPSSEQSTNFLVPT